MSTTFIKNSIELSTIKRIIGNIENAKKYLMKTVPDNLPYKVVSKGKNQGNKVINLADKEIWEAVIKNWDYDKSLLTIRELFTQTNKYKLGKEAIDSLKILYNEWDELNFGKIDWPFSQGKFDEFVQRINSQNNDRIEKDNKVKEAAVRYRRIKEINTLRNDFLETLIFEKNEKILPTLNHIRSVDFYIDGQAYDQKVARSPTKEFKKKYGENWKDVAIKNPEIIAEYLYIYQDEGRFGANPRLLVVYLDEDLGANEIEQIIKKTDLTNPIEITFTYNHKDVGQKTYKVKCFIILLYKEVDN